MGYYIRVLASVEKPVSLRELRQALSQKKLGAVLEVRPGDADSWEHLALKHPDGLEIARIDCNPVVEGKLGAAEIAEFLADLKGGQPESGARWLGGFLPTVKVIYLLQVLSGTERDGGWDAVHAVINTLRKAGRGIIQADGEGFSNEDGYHILWQFSDRVKGPWWMAVWQDRQWVTFRMDLGNKRHRESFMAGEVPAGITPGRDPDE